MPGSNSWLSLLWALVCVIVIVAMAYWATRAIAARGGLGAFPLAQGAQGLKVLSRMALGRDQQLVVVQAGERYFLLGVTSSAVSNLAEFTPEQAKAWPEQTRPEPPSFRQALGEVLQQKRRK